MNKVSLTELINPQPKQLEALKVLLDPRCKYLLYGGAMSGGKSYLLRWGALAYAIYLYRTTGIKEIPIGIFCEDYPTLKDRQISRIAREFPEWLGKIKDSSIDGMLFQIAEEYGAGKLLLRNLDDPTKYMSTEFAGEFVDELTRDPEQTFLDLRNRLRYPGIDEVKFMGATNPGGVGHGWVKKYFVDKKTEDTEQDRFFYVHANAYDNKFISPEYIKQLESLPPQQRKAYLEGSWDVFAGQFFPEWSRTKHIINPFVPHDKVIVGGLDWGRAKPFSFHLATVEKIHYRNDDGDIIPFYRTKTFFEVYGIEKSPEDWSKLIKQQMKDFYDLKLSEISWVQCDPTVFNKGNDNGVSIRDQFYMEDNVWTCLQPAKNDRIPGWTIMHKWLAEAPDGMPYYQVTTNCTNLIRTLPDAVHDELHVEDIDSNGEDHCLVKGTVINTIQGDKNIEEIKVGDEVLTRKGYRRVVNSGLTKHRAKVYKVTLSNNTSLTGTGNHPVYTKNRGFVLIDDLRYNDRVCNRLSLIQQFKSLMDKSIINAACISNAMVKDFILLFGNTIMVRSEEAFIFTMSIKIGRITVSQTYGGLELLSTYPYMDRSIPPIWNTWRRLESSLKSGMLQKRVKNGIANMLRMPGKTKSTTLKPAFSVTDYIKHQFLIDLNSVIQIAKPLILDINVRVLKVEYQNIQPVYNLTVEDQPEYFANGILVHNCLDDQRYMLRGIKMIEGKTGQIKPSLLRPEGNKGKFWGSNEVADAHLVDLSKFK